MSKSQPIIPEALVAFARDCVHGGYEERYAKVLDEAFFAHKVLLNASNLKQIVGGGSGTTAQRSVEEFKFRLHERLNYSIDLGANVPQEIASKFANALDAFWGYLREEAKGHWETERAELLKQVGKAQTKQIEAEEKMLATAADLTKAKSDLGQAAIDLGGARSAIELAVSETAAVRHQLEISNQAAQQWQGQAVQLQGQLTEQANRSERAYSSQADKFRSEQHEINQKHMLQLDATRTQARADVAKATESTEKLRAEVVKLTSEKSAAEANLSTAQAEIRVLAGAKRQLEEELHSSHNTSSAITAELRGRVAALGAQLAACQGSAVDAMGLLEWLHALDTRPTAEAPVSLPWPDGCAEARLANAILNVLAARRSPPAKTKDQAT